MNRIAVTYHGRGKHLEEWTITGIDTPVKRVIIRHFDVEQNIIRVATHADAVNFLRLKKLTEWKKRWRLSGISGFYRNIEDECTVYLPPSWEGFQLRPAMYWFLRYLLDGAWRDI